MEWTQIALYAAVGMLGLVFLCCAVNLVRVARKKEPSLLLSRAMYWLAMAAVVLNAARSAVAYTDKSMLIANLVVLVCVAVSYARMEKTNKYGEPENEEQSG